jgi:glycerol uptake facilitator-like aquaporin
MKKYIAEALGTFALSLVVALSIVGMFPVSTPILAAVTLGLFVYSIGHISGSHINPAVTIGFWSIGKIKTKEACAYIVSQFVGGFATLLVLSWIGVSSINLEIDNSALVLFAEIIGTFFFTFGIASVVYGKTPKELSGIVVGGSLFLGIAFAALMGSNGVLNPAVALPIGSFGLVYILGPILGSVLGMQAYKNLADN